MTLVADGEAALGTGAAAVGFFSGETDHAQLGTRCGQAGIYSPGAGWERQWMEHYYKGKSSDVKGRFWLNSPYRVLAKGRPASVVRAPLGDGR